MPRTCAVCRLPLAVQNEITSQRRRLVPYRDISRRLTEAGHALSKDAVYRHCEMHVTPADDPDSSASEPDLLVARAAADVLARWPSLARRLAIRLAEDGAMEAAEIVARTLTYESLEPNPLDPHPTTQTGASA